MQVMTILGGGAYEMMILSDYGFKKEESHGRSLIFCLGKPLAMSSFRKGLTSLGKLIRRCRNLLCQFCLLYVSVIDPVLEIVLGKSISA